MYFEKLRPPEVADCLVRGSTFIKWDDVSIPASVLRCIHELLSTQYEGRR